MGTPRATTQTLKQLVFGRTRHDSAGLPMGSTVFDGDTSDTVVNGLDEVRELGRTPGRETSDPDTLHPGRSYELPFMVRPPGSGEAEPTMLRFVAIRSGALAATFEAILPVKLDKERAAVDAALQRANKRPFSCEADADRAIAQRLAKDTMHTLEGRVEAFEVPGKRPRGRSRTQYDRGIVGM